MENEINKMLDEVIKEELSNLSSLESGSQKKTVAIDDLSRLYKLRIEENKNAKESDVKNKQLLMDAERITEEVKSHEQEEKLKKEQLSEQVKDRYFKLGIAAAELMIPLIFYGIWMRKGFKFEENGTYTSTTFRGLFNKFKPTKK